MIYVAGRHRTIEHFCAANYRIPYDRAFLYTRKAVATGNLVGLDDAVEQRHLLAVDRDGQAALKANNHGLGVGGAVLFTEPAVEFSMGRTP